MNVTPIGGKSPSSTVVGVAVDADGNVKTKKTWECYEELIYNIEKNDSANPPIDTLPKSAETVWPGGKPPTIYLTDCGAVSLRVDNGLDVDVKISIGTDVNYTPNSTAGWTYNLRRATSETNGFTIPKQTRYVSITPDDEPLLQWICRLNFAVKFDDVPSTGYLRIWLVRRR